MRIAIDIGYGYTKVVAEDGQRAVFPSVVAPVPPGTGALAEAFAGSATRDYCVTTWPRGRRDEARELLVGEAALASRGAMRAWEAEAADNPNLHVLAAVALALAGDDGPAEVAAGLPLGVYAAQRDSLKEALAGLDAVVMFDGDPDETRRAAVGSVFVFPQAAGAYYAACLTREGQVRDPALVRMPVGVIDVGYRTTDYLVMQRGPGGLAPRDDLSGSLEAGINHAVQDVRAAAEAAAGHPVDVVQVERALAWGDGRLYARGREIDLRRPHAEALKLLAERIASKVKLAWGDDADHLGAVLIAGGGGEALFPHLAAMLPAARLVPDALWANAEGYLAAQAAQALTVRAAANA